MASKRSTRRVAVLGGGIFGVSTAVHLARLGAEVTIVTQGSVASEASGRSLSWLNSSRRRSLEYHRLRCAGIDRYRSLSARHPEAAWLRFDGGLTWDADDDRNEIADVLSHEQGIGYHAILLRPEEVADHVAGVSADAITPQGAIFNPGEGWVDLPSLIRFLIEEFTRLGGVLVENAGRATIDVSGGMARAIVDADGTRYEADAVLLAAGAAVPDILAHIGVHLPDATPISLLVRTKEASLPLRAVLNTPRVAVRPTPDGALVLDAAWSEEEVEIVSKGNYRVRDETVEGLLREASRVLAGNPVLALDSYGVGPKPIPVDGEPVFGPLSEIDNLHVAFSHSGATLGLIAGELLASEICTGKPSPLLASFRPSRFS